MMKKAIYIILLLTVFMYACGENKTESETKTKTSTPKADVFKQSTSKQIADKFENISSRIASMPKYSFSSIKDPFYTIYLQVPTEDKKVPKIKGKPQVTQKYELERYKLIGIMARKQGNSAIFEDPEGKGWVLKEGNYIGNEGARIKKILLDTVIIEEPVIDSSGKLKYVERSISIKKLP